MSPADSTEIEISEISEISGKQKIYTPADNAENKIREKLKE